MALTPEQFNTLKISLQQRQKDTIGGKPLSGDAAKVFSITSTLAPDIEQLKTAFKQDYKGSLIGITSGTNRKLVKLVDNAADKVGRLRSGGAINPGEEARFKKQIASFLDIPFGKEDEAIAALDGILNEADTVAESMKPGSTLMRKALREKFAQQIPQTEITPETQPAIQPTTKIPISPQVQKIQKQSENKLNKVARFLGIEKFGQGIGQAIFQLTPEYKQLTKMLEQGEISPQEFKQISTGGLTNKEIIGSAIQTAALLPVGGAVGGIAKAGLKGSVLQGLKTGGLGGLTGGAISGVGQGIEKEGTIGGAVRRGIFGGILGGVSGGILGAGTGAAGSGLRNILARTGLSKGLQQQRLSAQAEKRITPLAKDISGTEYENLLRQGKITPKTFTKPAQYVLSETEKNTALKYSNLLKSDDPVKNSINLIGDIAKKDAEVGTFLDKNNAIFNKGKLKNYVMNKLQDVTDIAIDEKRITKLKQSLLNNFNSRLKKNDMKTLWGARKQFDKDIEKAFSGSPTLQNTMKKEFRNSIQDFIADNTPDNIYKTKMKDMTELFRLHDIVATKATKERGRNTIMNWAKNNPTKVKIIGGLGLGGIGYGILKD